MKKTICTIILSSLLALASCGERVDLTELTPSGTQIGEYSLYFNDERTFALDAKNRVGLSFDGELTELEKTGFYYITDSNGNKLTDANLKPLVDFPVGRCAENLTEVKAVFEDANATKWYVADASGIVFESPAYDEIVGLHQTFLAVEEKGILRLFTHMGEPLADLGALEDGLVLERIWYEQINIGSDEKPSYWISFRNSDDYESSTYGILYCYDPNSGELTVEENEGLPVYDKPVLYLYPESECEISVKFEHPERLTTVYPAYEDGWFVTAKPDGTLTDGRREYYALYWEEDGGIVPRFDEGFCVSSEEAAEFLESSLDTLGFTNREANEFIMYWLTILEKSPYNLVYFELTDSREGSNALIIEPTPDSLLRVAMHVKPLSEPCELVPQELPSFTRNGFVAVEWGGKVY